MWYQGQFFLISSTFSTLIYILNAQVSSSANGKEASTSHVLISKLNSWPFTVSNPYIFPVLFRCHPLHLNFLLIYTDHCISLTVSSLQNQDLTESLYMTEINKTEWFLIHCLRLFLGIETESGRPKVDWNLLIDDSVWESERKMWFRENMPWMCFSLRLPILWGALK